MALPTLEKTWDYDFNNLAGNLGNQELDNADTWVKIKDILIGMPGGFWSVLASSDGTGGNADLNDNWTDYTNITWNTAGNAHSWMVLENSATGFQICMDCASSTFSSEQSTVYMSPGGNYALGGVLSNLNRPSAVDEVSLKLLGKTGYTLPAGRYIHAWCSDDGECTRVIVCVGGAAQQFWLLDQLQNPVEPLAGPWSTPFVGVVESSDAISDLPTYGNYNDRAALHGVYSGEFLAYMTSEGYASAMAGENLTTVDSLSNAWVMCPIGVISTTALNNGRKGYLSDIWWGSTTRLTGDTYPNDGSYQFVQFGDMILPWDGSTPLISV